MAINTDYKNLKKEGPDFWTRHGSTFIRCPLPQQYKYRQ